MIVRSTTTLLAAWCAFAAGMTAACAASADDENEPGFVQACAGQSFDRELSAAVAECTDADLNVMVTDWFDGTSCYGSYVCTADSPAVAFDASTDDDSSVDDSSDAVQLFLVGSDDTLSCALDSTGDPSSTQATTGTLGYRIVLVAGDQPVDFDLSVNDTSPDHNNKANFMGTLAAGGRVVLTPQDMTTGTDREVWINSGNPGAAALAGGRVDNLRWKLVTGTPGIGQTGYYELTIMVFPQRARIG